MPNDRKTSSRKPRHQGRPRRPKPIPKNLPVSASLKNVIGSTLDDGPYVVFDIETTGGNPEKNGITEIFALKYHQGKIGETFYSLVDPGIPIPPIVRRMTGITNKMLKGEPKISAVMPGFLEFVGDDVLVSHNTIGDMKFLRYFAEKCCNVEMGNFYLCTHLLVEKLVSEAPDKSLKGLADHFSLPAEKDLHRAEADAYVTLELFKVLLQRLHKNEIGVINEAIRLQGDLESAMRMGWGVPPEQINPPSKPGVFYLYDHQDKPIFLCGSPSLDREVKKLNNYAQLPRQLLRTILKAYRMSFEEAADPFSALIAECDALSKHKVLFQPAGWHQRTVQAINIIDEGEGTRVSVGPVVAGAVAAFGPVRDRKEAQQFIEKIGEACGGKPTRKGLSLPTHCRPALLALVSGQVGPHIAQLKKRQGRIFSKIFKASRQQIKFSLDLLTPFQGGSVPRWESMLETSGAIGFPQNRSQETEIYCIDRAMPGNKFRVTMPLDDHFYSLATTRQTILKKLGSFQSRQVGLTEHEASKVNATLWYVHSTRGQQRFISRNELESWVEPV